MKTVNVLQLKSWKSMNEANHYIFRSGGTGGGVLMPRR